MKNSNISNCNTSQNEDENDIVLNDYSMPVDDDDVYGTCPQVGGAAALGCIAGLLMAGPICGLVTAGGAAAIATSRGKAGDFARASGDTVLDAGERLKRFDRKHRVVEKTSNGVVQGCNWVSTKFNNEEKLRQSQRQQMA